MNPRLQQMALSLPKIVDGARTKIQILALQTKTSITKKQTCGAVLLTMKPLHFNELTDFLDNMSLQERHKLWFVYDGCPSHSARIVSEWLNGEFGDKWLGRNTDPRWPPRSPYLTPIDFFMGILKAKSL